MKTLPIAAAIACWLVGAIAIAARLREAADRSLTITHALAINLSSVFASHVAFGAAAGEAARVAWLTRYSNVRRAAGIIVVDRVADGIALVTVLAASITWVALPLVLLAAWKRLTMAFASVAAWIVDLARIWLTAHAVGVTLGPKHLAAIALAAAVGSQAPTPAGLGAVEGAMVAAGAALGVPAPALLKAVVLDRALTLGLGTGLGAVASAWLARIHRRSP